MMQKNYNLPPGTLSSDVSPPEPPTKECPMCEGAGVIDIKCHLEGETYLTDRIECPYCDGTGKVIDDN